jgi:hypothetical protein
MGSKLALQGTHLARNSYQRLIIIQILTLWQRRTSHSRPVGAASFVKEIHSAPLKMEEFFGGCGTAKAPVSMAL